MKKIIIFGYKSFLQKNLFNFLKKKNFTIIKKKFSDLKLTKCKPDDFIINCSINNDFFYKKYKIISLIALGCFFTEAIILAISKIGAFALIPLSIKFAEAGFPESSYFQTLGDLLYYGIDRQLYHIHMLFFILGGILWYYLFYKTRYIPRIISVWGLLAVGLISINVLLVLYNRDFGSIIILFLPYMPFELFLGVWLIVKGFNSSAIRATKTEITQA